MWIVLDQLTHAIDEAGEVLAAQFAHGIEEHKLGPVLAVGESLGGDSAVLHDGAVVAALVGIVGGYV